MIANSLQKESAKKTSARHQFTTNSLNLTYIILVYYLLFQEVFFPTHTKLKLKLKLNSLALVRERTIPTGRPPPLGEVSANFCW